MPGLPPSDLRAFLLTLRDRAGPHGQVFRYISPNSDLLGWVLERASGQRYADLLSEAIWKPMGADREAYVTVDRFGAPRAAGGLCMTLRDLARLGLLLINGGARDGTAVLPAAWIDDLVANGDRAAWEAGDFAASFPGVTMHYRSQWYVMGAEAPVIFALGIHGQLLYADPRRELVIAKLSSQPMPLDEAKDRLALSACQAIGAALAE